MGESRGSRSCGEDLVFEGMLSEAERETDEPGWMPWGVAGPCLIARGGLCVCKSPTFNPTCGARVVEQDVKQTMWMPDGISTFLGFPQVLLPMT